MKKVAQRGITNTYAVVRSIKLQVKVIKESPYRTLILVAKYTFDNSTSIYRDQILLQQNYELHRSTN
jgi:hypothetical protein